jgi:hypothetical protein
MKKTKAAKAAEYFLKYPNATPKDVGAKFSMHLPQVYAIRKRVLTGALDSVLPAVDNNADQQQVGGNHYKDLSVQPWVAMESWMTTEQFAGFLRGNAIKYLARCDSKGGLEDVKKAQHYIQKLLEVLQ